MANEAGTAVAPAVDGQKASVASSNETPSVVPYERVQKLSSEKRLLAEERDRLRLQLEQYQQELYAARNSSTPAASTGASDSDTEAWMGNVVKKVLQSEIGPINQTIARIQADTAFANWSTNQGRYLDNETLGRIRETYLAQVANDPSMAAKISIQDIARWELGRAQEAELQERAERALYQQTVSAAPVSVGEVKSTVAPEKPVDKTSEEYIKNASSAELYAMLREQGM